MASPRKFSLSMLLLPGAHFFNLLNIHSTIQSWDTRVMILGSSATRGLFSNPRLGTQLELYEGTLTLGLILKLDTYMYNAH